MPDISQMKSSKFLAQGDCINGPKLLIMNIVTQENVAKQGADEELKWCLHFTNEEKPLVLNQINMQMIAKITGHTNTDDWTGKQIVVYFDPAVAMGGKITGGLRVRAPRIKPAVTAAPAPAPVAPPVRPAIAPPAPPATPTCEASEPDDDSVPF